jgi:hypothetical protein
MAITSNDNPSMVSPYSKFNCRPRQIKTLVSWTDYFNASEELTAFAKSLVLPLGGRALSIGSRPSMQQSQSDTLEK